MSFKLSGQNKFMRNVSRIRDSKGPKTYRTALSKILLNVERESIKRTPIDTGHLRRSAAGNSTVYSADKKGAKGIVYYTANYAVWVHERTEMRHTVGEAKYLQNAIADVKRSLPYELAFSLKYGLDLG